MHRRTIALIAIFALLLLGGAAIYLLVGDLPAPEALITRSSPDATKIYDRNGRLLFEVLDPRAGRRTRVPLSELPLNLRRAVIAVEDAHFYENPGFDLTGLVRAAIQNLQAGQIVAGGSTITQQLARDLLLSREERASRSYLRKLREVILSVRMTLAFSKDTILEMYLNEVYFGQLAYGAEAAARTFFGKPARDLDLAESALLAGIIQSPYAYNPLVNLDAARARQRVALGLMVKNGFITEAESSLAEAEPLHFASASAAATLRAPHFVTYVRNLLEEQYGPETVNRGGLRVVTTLDLDLQERAEAIIRQQLEDLSRRTRQEGAPDFNLHDAALVALDPTTGEILAMVGSADYFDETIDGAVNVALANRQPGSAIKPITYATAFAGDLTPASVLSDVPTSFLTRENVPYEPQNYDQMWHGPISLRQALATSSNIVAVKVLDHVGVRAMIETAQALGISTFDDPDRFGLALTLGGGEVKLLELTAAYAAFPNQGRRVDPVPILSVNGVPWATPRPAIPVIRPQVAYQITSILSDDSARIPAFGEDSVLRLSRPAAAKTGTTTDFRDNWTIGYTPDLVVGVWAGNADNEPMYKISGITGAGPIWHDFMEEALKDRPVQNFVRPPGLVDVEICDTSGLLPTDACPRRRTEVFIAGTEPIRPDDSYRVVALDSATDLLWVDRTTPGGQACQGSRVERVFRILPPDAQEWGLKQGIPTPPTEDCLFQVASSKLQVPSSILPPSGPIPLGNNLKLETGNLKLVLSSPAPNSTFYQSAQIPDEFQKVQVAARLASPTTPSQVTLLVDDQPIGTFARPPYRALWGLALGEHVARAVGIDADGSPMESAPIRFHVEAPEKP